MKKLSSVLIRVGIICIILAFILFIFIFYPVISTEVTYQVNTLTKETKQEIKPLDSGFGIVIPKIRANAKIVANVNPYSSREYQFALTKGVAHAKGTDYPGQEGNVFLFSHSSVNFYEASRYNSIFYLLDKMEKGDRVELYYKNEKFIYKVTDKKVVLASDVKYLENGGNGKTLVLMTCWPAGTSWKRLLILA